MKIGTILIFILANIAAAIGIVNPWIPAWQTAGSVFLFLEAAFLLLIGLPVFLYHFLIKKKPVGQSLNDAIDSVLSFLAGWV